MRVGRRGAINGWWYAQNYRASLRGYQARSQGLAGWTLRFSLPRSRRYATGRATLGGWGRHVHIVRDQIVATRDGAEYRVTRYLCGGMSWHGQLLSETTTVCRKCACAEAGGGQVPVAHVR